MVAGRSVRGPLAALATLAVLATGCGLAPSAAEVASRAGDAGSSADETDPGQTDPEHADPGQTDPEESGSEEVTTSTPADVPSNVPKGLVEFYTQELSWKECLPGGFECSKLRVPIDYDEPGGKTIELALLRFPAKDPSERIGSLVVNPGGPGGSGTQYASLSPGVFGPKVKDSYDIVGFDPRGVAKSAPVDCVSDQGMDRYLAVDGSPDTEQEQASLQRLVSTFAEGCQERTGELLGHVSTREVARDMDVLRGALGDEQLHYFGASYGTYLGATYAGLFPNRVGRMALDGGLDPALSATDIGLGQARGFERALKSFIDRCTGRDDCPLGDTSEEAYATLDQLLADLDAQPLPGDGRRELTQSLAVSGIVYTLYSTALWADLRNSLGAALEGDGSGLLRLADQYSRRSSDGSYKDNSGEAILAVNCLDKPDLGSIAEAEALEPRFVEASPRFGATILWGSLACAEWPVEPTGKPREIQAKGAKPILVVGTTRDPATPYEWSVSLAEQLDSGVLLTREGDGHTGYGMGLTPCIDTKVDAYLVEGAVPKDGTRCGD